MQPVPQERDHADPTVASGARGNQRLCEIGAVRGNLGRSRSGRQSKWGRPSAKPARNLVHLERLANSSVGRTTDIRHTRDLAEELRCQVFDPVSHVAFGARSPGKGTEIGGEAAG